jgi:hypothetical protein
MIFSLNILPKTYAAGSNARYLHLAPNFSDASGKRLHARLAAGVSAI